MKLRANKTAHLYLLNASLLATHEIDSAYWREWELFHLPGGIEFFLIINFALLWVVLFGFKQVVLSAPTARVFSYLLAGAGIFAFLIHAAFIVLGHTQFSTSISVGLLVAILLVSVVQLIDTVFSWSRSNKLPVSPGL